MAWPLDNEDSHIRAYALVLNNFRGPAILAYDELLRRWPDDVLALSRKAAVLISESRWNDAQETAGRLARIPAGRVIGYTLAARRPPQHRRVRRGRGRVRPRARARSGAEADAAEAPLHVLGRVRQVPAPDRPGGGSRAAPASRPSAREMTPRSPTSWDRPITSRGCSTTPSSAGGWRYNGSPAAPAPGGGWASSSSSGDAPPRRSSRSAARRRSSPGRSVRSTASASPAAASAGSRSPNASDARPTTSREQERAALAPTWTTRSLGGNRSRRETGSVNPGVPGPGPAAIPNQPSESWPHVAASESQSGGTIPMTSPEAPAFESSDPEPSRRLPRSGADEPPVVPRAGTG